MFTAESLDDIEALADRAPVPVVLIFDADNTLTPQGATSDVFRADVAAARQRFEALAAVGRVVVATNGRERGVPGIIPGANKPWTSRRRLGLEADSAVWVVGDQVLTDGLLAWRLGAVYVHLVVSEDNESRRQAMMRRIGRVLIPALFAS
jgi:predicted HAD superfamily phosphohydrolase YqeG